MAQARILIVEDEVSVARDLQARLAQLGYIVVGVTAFGEETLPLAEQTQPDLVLMAICLHGPGGETPPAAVDRIEAAEHLRRKLQRPVVYVTAQADEATRERVKLMDPLGYVLEPFAERELRMVVEMALYKHQAERRLRESEAQLQQAQKMEAIGRLAGGVAHDFNNLLTVINGYCDLLLGGAGADHPWRGFLEEIHKAGERAADLTRRLLAFSRQQLLQPRLLDLNTVVAGVEKMLRRLIGEHIELGVSLDPALGPVLADPGQLEQVLLNLAVNARDAMPRGGKLTLETREVRLTEPVSAATGEVPAGPYRRLRVSDTGCGMDQATLARIFEPFFTTKEAGKGTGLGLPSVYAIVRQSDGHITVASAPGKGSTFTLYFPPARAKTPPAPSSVPGLPELPRGSETVLLVEDEEGVRSLGRQVLQMCGYTVLEAHDGAEALRLSGRYTGRIDLLVTDVVMPRLGGPALVERLTRERPGLKVLCMSGFHNSVLHPHGVQEGDEAFLAKPFSPLALARKVRSVLDQPPSAAWPGRNLTETGPRTLL